MGSSCVGGEQIDLDCPTSLHADHNLDPFPSDDKTSHSVEMSLDVSTEIGAAQESSSRRTMCKKRAKRSISDTGWHSSITCQVCNLDLVAIQAKAYCLKKRVCPEHLQAEVVYLPGQEAAHRFCHQCGKFELLVCFDGLRRSCRERTAQRRVKYHTQLETLTKTSPSTGPGAAAAAAAARGGKQANNNPYAAALSPRASTSGLAAAAAAAAAAAGEQDSPTFSLGAASAAAAHTCGPGVHATPGGGSANATASMLLEALAPWLPPSEQHASMAALASPQRQHFLQQQQQQRQGGLLGGGASAATTPLASPSAGRPGAAAAADLGSLLQAVIQEELHRCQQQQQQRQPVLHAGSTPRGFVVPSAPHPSPVSLGMRVPPPAFAGLLGDAGTSTGLAAAAAPFVPQQQQFAASPAAAAAGGVGSPAAGDIAAILAQLLQVALGQQQQQQQQQDAPADMDTCPTPASAALTAAADAAWQQAQQALQQARQQQQQQQVIQAARRLLLQQAQQLLDEERLLREVSEAAGVLPPGTGLDGGAHSPTSPTPPPALPAPAAAAAALLAAAPALVGSPIGDVGVQPTDRPLGSPAVRLLPGATAQLAAGSSSTGGSSDLVALLSSLGALKGSLEAVSQEGHSSAAAAGGGGGGAGAAAAAGGGGEAAAAAPAHALLPQQQRSQERRRSDSSDSSPPVGRPLPADLVNALLEVAASQLVACTGGHSSRDGGSA